MPEVLEARRYDTGDRAGQGPCFITSRGFCIQATNRIIGKKPKEKDSLPFTFFADSEGGVSLQGSKGGLGESDIAIAPLGEDATVWALLNAPKGAVRRFEHGRELGIQGGAQLLDRWQLHESGFVLGREAGAGSSGSTLGFVGLQVATELVQLDFFFEIAVFQVSGRLAGEFDPPQALLEIIELDGTQSVVAGARRNRRSV